MLLLALMLSERVLNISRAVLRRGGAAGCVAPRLQISLEYAPSSRLAIRPTALAIPLPIYFQNALSLLFPSLLLAGQTVLAGSNSDSCYVGAESCRSCHPGQYQLWQVSNHALAERPVRKDMDQAAFTPTRRINHASQTSLASLEQGGFRITTLGFQTNVAPYPVERAIGNSPVRQYLTAAEKGRWQVHELAYDPARNEWFDVYGSEDRKPGLWGHWTGGGMNWNSRCAACHNTRLRKNYDPSSDSYSTTMAAMGVDCEGCHGPLQGHVDWRKANTNSKVAEPFPPVVRRSQTLDTCAACHSRREELTGDFQPGDSFYDHFSLEILDEGGRWYADGQIKEEDYEFESFLGSRMLQAGLHCRDCHRADSGTGNALCLRCHQGTNAAFRNAPVIQPAEHGHHKLSDKGGECIGCHMPTTVYMQRHPRHDHGFGSPDPLLTRELGIPNACNRCHADKNADWAVGYVDKWYGAKMNRHSRERTRWIAAALKGGDSSVRHLTEMLGDDKEGVYWQAVGAGLLRRWSTDPEPAQALLAALRHGHPLVREKAVLALEPAVMAEDSQAVAGLNASLNDPVRSVRVAAAWVLRASVDMQSRAGKELEQSLEFNLDQPRGRYHKAILLLSRGEPTEALAQFQKAIAMDPVSPPLRCQTALLLEQLGRKDEALRMLVEGEKALPTDPRLPFAQASFFARNQRLEEARAAANRALKLEPESPSAKELLKKLDAGH
jgi:tetratricopeptide (TPR) repeat protein